MFHDMHQIYICGLNNAKSLWEGDMRVNELVVHKIKISFHEQLMKLSISYHNKFIHS